MARTRRKTDEQKKLITATWAKDKQAPYFRVYADLFESEAYQRLTATAKVLYIDMALRSGGNMEPFTYPRHLNERRYSHDGFTYAKNQLRDSGFITEQKVNRKESLYRLSGEWMRVHSDNSKS